MHCCFAGKARSDPAPALDPRSCSNNSLEWDRNIPVSRCQVQVVITGNERSANTNNQQPLPKHNTPTFPKMPMPIPTCPFHILPVSISTQAMPSSACHGMSASERMHCDVNAERYSRAHGCRYSVFIRPSRGPRVPVSVSMTAIIIIQHVISSQLQSTVGRHLLDESYMYCNTGTMAYSSQAPGVN